MMSHSKLPGGTFADEEEGGVFRGFESLMRASQITLLSVTIPHPVNNHSPATPEWKAQQRLISLCIILISERL